MEWNINAQKSPNEQVFQHLFSTLWPHRPMQFALMYFWPQRICVGVCPGLSHEVIWQSWQREYSVRVMNSKCSMYPWFFPWVAGLYICTFQTSWKAYWVVGIWGHFLFCSSWHILMHQLEYRLSWTMHYAEVNCCVVLSVEGAVLMVNVYVDVMEWDGSHHPFVSLHGKPYQSWSSHMCTIGELLPVAYLMHLVW